MEVKRNAKKARAALIAGALAAAIALTGTLAWINMSQEAANEFVLEKNPGGRIHDDFKGVENKDVYAENFSSLEDGAPIFVRVKLLEYMETGADAGINRKTPEGADVPMQDRNVKPLVAGANINDTSTWYAAKPGETNPFRVYWTWEQSGQTVYMPTFNKNKDSVSVDVNGTYVGADGDFTTGEPYDDYVTYALGTPPTEGEEPGGGTGGAEDDGTVKQVTADAFYDADKNTDDENYDADGNWIPDSIPGAGGVEVTEENPEGNFRRVEETHYGTQTLKSLEVITMDQWIAAGRPVCNKWIWDEDGWFYWPEPILPQTATGLLLDKVVSAKAPSEKCYYAIDVVGQFVDSDRSSWGSPETTNAAGQKVDATGFYIDGITDNALDLLDQASRVEIVTDEETKVQTWYLSQGSNVYRKIDGDEGTLGEPLCAGPDITPATEDDCTDIEYVPAGVTVNGTDYGNYFLLPTDAEDYYRAVGKDGLLGTADDDRLWLTEGGEFPTGMTDEIVDAVTVSQAENKTQVEVKHTLAFSAQVQLNGAPASSQDVTWSVAPGGKFPLTGTSIDENGVLTVGENETNPQLVITAASKLDDRQKNTYTVTVLGKSNVQLAAEGGVASLQAGKTLRFTATACHGSVPLDPQPEITWSAAAATRDVNVNELTVEDGLLKVGRNRTGSVVVTASYENEYGDTVTGTKTILLTDAEAVTVTLIEPEGEKTLEAGQTLSGYTAAISGPVEELGTQEITWKAGTSTDNGQTITTVTGITMPNGVLTVASDYDITRGDAIYIQAIAKDVSAKGAKAVCTQPVTIIGPDSIEITVKDGKSAKVNPGKTRQLIATVKRADGSEYASQAVKWEISGSSNTTGTTINQSGLLTAASDETVGGKLVVTATSKVDPSLSKTINVSVVDEVEIDGREVTIDGDVFIVLTQDEAKNQTLLLLKTPVEQMAYADSKTVTWGDSNVKAYLNNANEGGWLNGRNELQNMLKETTVYSVIKVSVTNNLDTGVLCKVFLLSHYDISDSGGSSLSYKEERTAGGKLVWPNGIEGWRAFEKGSTQKLWWLRSSYENGPAGVIEYNNSVDNWYFDYNKKAFVRPAMWVDTTKLAPYLSGS